MRRVYSSYTPFQAHLTAQFLREEGLSPEVRNESLNRVIGGVPLTESMVEVWVPEEEATRAERLLHENETREEIDNAGERAKLAQCPACGAQWEPGFDRCWNCSYVTSA